MKTEIKKLKFYFLGTLSPEDVTEMDLQIMTDLDFAAQLDAAETELIEDYLENTLTDKNLKLFETNYLITPGRFERVEFIKSLRKVAKSNSSILDFNENKSSFFESIKSFFNPPKLAFGLGIFILLLTFGIVWRVILVDNSVNNEIAVLNKKDLSNLEEYKENSVISLISNNLRSVGDTKTLESNKLAGILLVRLAIPQSVKSNELLQFNLVQDKKIIVNFNQARIYQNQNGQEVRLLIPASILKKGEYQIELKSSNQNEFKISYAFVVQ